MSEKKQDESGTFLRNESQAWLVEVGAECDETYEAPVYMDLTEGTITIGDAQRTIKEYKEFVFCNSSPHTVRMIGKLLLKIADIADDSIRRSKMRGFLK